MTEAQVNIFRIYYHKQSDKCDNCPTDDEFEPDRKIKGDCFQVYMHNHKVDCSKGVEQRGTITLEQTGKVIPVSEIDMSIACPLLQADPKT